MTLPLPRHRVRRASAEFRTRRFAGLGVVPVLLSSLAWVPAPALAASAAAPAASQSGCGSGPSWATKIGTDSQASQVDQASPPVRTTVAQLTSLPLPSSIQHRVRPTETTVYTITATINDITVEHDRDLHLAVNGGSGRFMITELPDLACVPRSSAFYSGISRAHSQLAAWSGKLPATVQITGVGFFDGYTGQSDQAPNQIELHPILNLNFSPGSSPGSIAGRLTSSAGGAISGATVSDSGGASVSTDGSGNYTLSGLAAGQHTVTAAASGFVSQNKSVTVTSGNTSTANFVLTSSQTTGGIAGTVTNASDGADIAGVVVNDDVGDSATTDSLGAYAISGLTPGRHRVTAAMSGFASQSKTVTVTSGQNSTADFALASSQTTGTVTGTVTSASDGSIVPGAAVSESGGARATTDSSGVYTISGLAPGSHSLTASAGGFVSQTKSVNVTAGNQSSADFALTAMPQSGAPQFVQAAGVTENSAASSLSDALSAPTSTGNLLVLSASVYTGVSNPITGVSDTGGNTWTRIGAFGVAGHYSDGEMWYAANARSVTSVSVQTASPVVASLEVQEFSGVATTSPLDVSAGSSNTSVSPGSGSVTPTAANELVVGFVAGHSYAQAINVTSPGYTAQAELTSNGGGMIIAELDTGYRVLSSASAQSFSGSCASPMYWSAGIATFKAGT
jgi:Carboxypeptidase regulatory-like domain